MVTDGVSTEEAYYFFLPLWNSTFSPYAEHLGVIDWFTLLLGVIGVVVLAIHGANWVIFKTNSDINQKLKNVVYFLSFVLLGLVVISVLTYHFIVPKPFHNFTEHIWLWLFPLITLAGLFGLFKIKSFKKDGTGFIFSTLFLVGGLTTTLASIFPKVLPSTNSVNPSLTIYNVIAHEYGLSQVLSGLQLQWFWLQSIWLSSIGFLKVRWMMLVMGSINNINNPVRIIET